MHTKLFQHPSLEGFAPISLELYISDHDIEMEGSLMITGVTSRFQFMSADGKKIELPRTNDKVLAYSFFVDQGDEWQDVLDKLAYHELIDPQSGKVVRSKMKSRLWREQSGLTPSRFERLSKLAEDGVRPTGNIRRRSLANRECLSLGMTFKGANEGQRSNFSNMFFASSEPSKYMKITINDIYFSMAADSEAPTIAAFEQESAPIFLYSDPKLSLHSR